MSATKITSGSLATVPLVAALYIVVLSNDPTAALPSQLAAIGLLVLSAAICLLTNRVRSIPVTPVEILLIATFILSLLANIASDDSFSYTYTVLFLVTCLSFSVVSRSLSMEDMLRSARIAFVLIAATAVLLQYDLLLTSLRGDFVYGLGIYRFRPFNTHPNLVGFMYGGGGVLLLVSAANQKGMARLISIGVGLGLMLCVLGASARAGLLAAAFSLALHAAYRYRRQLLQGPWGLAMIGLALIPVVFGYANNILDYLSRILDLASSTRGLDSGGTGRFDLWASGLDYLSDASTLALLFGSGLRSASTDNIGFSTESSLITLLIENGIVAGTLLVLAPLTTIYAVLKGRNRIEQRSVIVAVLLFASVQSIFNRYLLAIGNSFSLFILMLLIAVAVHLRDSRSLESSRASGPGSKLNQKEADCLPGRVIR